MSEQSNNVRRFPRRGTFLLLDHCSRLEQLGAELPSARDRLEGRLGIDLSKRLVGSLAGDHSLRPRDVAA